MTCADFRNCFLDHDPDPIEALSADARAHLADCSACRRALGQLARLEQNYRQSPLSEECSVARATFLRRVAAPSASAAPAAPIASRRRWTSATAWLVAVAVLAALGLGIYIAMPPAGVSSGDVLDLLVAWNVTLSETPLEERADIFAQEERRLRSLVDTASFPPEDREVSQKLFDNVVWLVNNDDPIATADRFDELAEIFEHRLDADTEVQGPTTQAAARHFHDLSVKGVRPNLEKTRKKGLHVQQPQKFKRLEHRDHARRAQIDRVLAAHPELTRQQVRRDLGIPGKKKGKKN